jgi:hypothetical protein
LSEAIHIDDVALPALELISHRITARGREKWKPPPE